MPEVVVVDYGMGNLGSMRRALEECGAVVVVSDRAEDLGRASHIVLPGVGAFPDGMDSLRARGLDQALTEQALGQGIPLLGVCLGMELMAGTGHEVRACAGLGWIPGDVLRLVPVDGEKIPHIGWDQAHPARPHPVLDGIVPGADFYFVHSFHLRASDPASVLATTPFCGGFASMVARGSIVGTQFHPEKSQRVGLRLLRNFLAWNGEDRRPC